MTDQPDRQPIRTFSDASHRYDSTRPGTALSHARERFEELSDRDVSARAIATLKARGEYQPGPHHNEAMYPPLTGDEHLEVLALGELLARYYRHPTYVHHALTAGASWAQISGALGCGEGDAREAYRRWADGQHQLWRDYDCKFGMDAGEHARAVRRAAEPDAEIEAGQ